MGLPAATDDLDDPEAWGRFRSLPADRRAGRRRRRRWLPAHAGPREPDGSGTPAATDAADDQQRSNDHEGRRHDKTPGPGGGHVDPTDDREQPAEPELPAPATARCGAHGGNGQDRTPAAERAEAARRQPDRVDTAG